MSKKTWLVGLLILQGVVARTAEVNDLTARQRWPWNNLVDIDFVVATNGTEITPFFHVDVTGTYDGVKPVIARMFAKAPVAAAGTNRVTWSMGTDYPDLKLDTLSITVTVSEVSSSEPVYLVVDLTGGPNASGYPYQYTTAMPDLTGDLCRTTELWLRRIPAGTFNIWTNNVSVTLTKAFYIGVFEVTQRQYELVMGTNPSYFTNTLYNATRPVDSVMYSYVRGDTLGMTWPDSSAVDDDSFVGRLRNRTSIIGFDLPTDAQWEYACRAGTTGDFNVDEASINELGRYSSNSSYNSAEDMRNDDTTKGTARVGSYLPNTWGLYDMHANMYEWCRDWFELIPVGGIDPPGAPSGGTLGIKRGGSWQTGAGNCKSWYRSQAFTFTEKRPLMGFRIAITEP